MMEKEKEKKKSEKGDFTGIHFMIFFSLSSSHQIYVYVFVVNS